MQGGLCSGRMKTGSGIGWTYSLCRRLSLHLGSIAGNSGVPSAGDYRGSCFAAWRRALKHHRLQSLSPDPYDPHREGHQANAHRALRKCFTHPGVFHRAHLEGSLLGLGSSGLHRLRLCGSVRTGSTSA